IAAGVMSNGLEVAPVRLPEEAVSVYPLPTLLIDRLLNVAVPATAALGVVPLSVPPPGLVPMATPTLAVLLVRLPNWSRMRTVTAGVIVAPAFALLGCTPKASWLAAAALIVKVLLA